MIKHVAQISVGCCLLFILAVSGVPFTKVSAQSTGSTPVIARGSTHIGDPFGGLIQKKKPCTCSFNEMLYVNDTVTKQQLRILNTPGISRPYAHYVTQERKQILGTYTPGAGICLQISASGCEPDREGWHGEINSGPGFGVSMMPGGSPF
ncbi:MAG: hypothetical protein RL150_596 [Candidatus Parcubacteria bacterium]